MKNEEEHGKNENDKYDKEYGKNENDEKYENNEKRRKRCGHKIYSLDGIDAGHYIGLRKSS